MRGRTKHRGDPWIGELHEGWSLKRLGVLGTLTKGRGGSKEDNRESGIPVVRYGDLYTRFGTTITEAVAFVEESDASRYTALPHSAIVFAASGESAEDIGKSALSLLPEPALVGGDTVVFRPGSEVYPPYLAYALESFPIRSHKAFRSTGFTVVHISASRLKTIPIPLPSLPVQRAIAAFLDRETAQIDALIGKQHALVDRLRERRRAVIERSTSFGTTSEALVETSNAWVPALPASWTLTRIKLVATKSAGGTPDTEDPRMWANEEDGGTPWVAIGDMSKRRCITETAKRVSEQGRSSRRLSIGAPGTVLFAMYASVGEVAQLATPACWNQALLGLSGRPRLVTNEFLYYALLSMRSRFSAMFRSNTQNNLNAAQVGDLDLALPPLGSQQEIVNYLDRQTARIDALIDKAQRFIELARERRSALITAAVTGQIDVTETGAV